MTPQICLVVASEMTVKAFLLGHVRALSELYEVAVVVDTDNPRLLEEQGVEAELVQLRIAREIRPSSDVAAFARLVRLFRRRRFDLVHSVTPKAGLLAMTAGLAAGIPRRLHTFTGQVWATRRGVARAVLRQADRAIAAAATHLLADSPSQRDFLVAERVVAAAKIGVLGAGSVAGVDLDRFRPDGELRRRVRIRLGIGEDAVVFCFIGRLKQEKGLLTLADAFHRLSAEGSDAHLLIIGPDEEGVAPRLRAACPPDRLHLVGYTDSVEEYIAASDVFCLPSHREGFGSVIIEAAAAGVPSIASRIYGLTDAVVDGVTGVLHPVGDSAALHSLMRRMVDEPAYRAALGLAARQRAVSEFSSAGVTSELLEYYRSTLSLAPAQEAR